MLLHVGAAMVVIPALLGAKAADDSRLRGGTAKAAIPLVGPWLVYAQAKRENVKDVAFPMLLDGVAQAIGVVLITASFLSPERTSAHEGVSLHITPTTVAPGAYGLGAVGTF
jgi:hypothetical protein